MFALLGPNGAGKTTAIHILVDPDLGRRRRGARRRVRRRARTQRRPRRDRPHRPDLGGRRPVHGRGEPAPDGRPQPPRQGGRAGGASPSCSSGSTSSTTRPSRRSTYSGGMRRRLDLAMTLVGDPRIIFLDEPTTGLDPRSRRVMWDIVRELVADGVTIFLTTQYLEEADRLAGRIALLDGGRVVAQGTPAELKRLVPGGSVRLEFGDEAALDRAAAHASATARATTRDSRSSSRTTAASTRCAPCSTGSMPRRSRSPGCPSDPPTSTTCSCPSPAATTATTPTRRCRRHERLRAHRFPNDAPAKPPPDAPLPVPDVLHRGDPGHPPAPVRVRARRHAGRRARRVGLPTGPNAASIGREAYIAYIVPGILLMTAAGTGHRDGHLRGDGHDGRDHRPLPDDGDRARRRSSPATSSAASSRRRWRRVIVVAVALLVGFRPTTEPAGLGRGRRAPRADVVRRELAVGRPGPRRPTASRPPATRR